nr:hypothetical protein [Candidatus Sigynarchaeota archaeon]
MSNTGEKISKDALDNELSVFVPNFNEAILSIVFFHINQSIPLLRYDFKRSGDYKQAGYNFSEELLSGMISAILTVSEEIDKEHKSLLRKIDQTTYNILVTMGKKAGLMLITLIKEESEQILREFSSYLLAEFERRFKDLLFSDVKSFDKDMFLDFIPVIEKIAEIPIAISPELLVHMLPAIRALAPSVNVVICDKLVFMPIFKQVSDYITPNELQQLRTFLKEIVLGSTKFLDLVQKFGAMETITLKTAKKHIYIANLNPFYVIIFTRASVPESEVMKLLETLNDGVLKDTLVLSTRQKALLFQGIDLVVKNVPGLEQAALQKQIIKGLKDFQKEDHILFRNIEQYNLDEKKKIINLLFDFFLSRLSQHFDTITGLQAKLKALSEKFLAIYIASNGLHDAGS